MVCAGVCSCPVRLDLVAPPLGFGEVQYAELAAWSGSDSDPRFHAFLSVVQSIVRAEPVPYQPPQTHFEAPGVKLENARLENVQIHLGERSGPAEDDAPEPSPPPAETRERLSLSMLLTRTIGIVFPLIAIAIFVFTIGNLACNQGNAPAAFCRVLKSVANSP